MLVMALHTPEAVTYAPLYLHSFQLVQPRTLVEAEKFNIRFTDPSQINNTADKLRWCRHRNGLRQRDVANYVGIDRRTFSNYEECGRDDYPIENMQKIAELFSIPVTELLDDYNLFLYNGQGRKIKEMRRRGNMTQPEFARYLGVPFGTLQAWEQDRVQIFKSTWEKLMRND